MSKNPSDKNRVPADDEEQKRNAAQAEQDQDKGKRENRRQGVSMGRLQEGQKFVSDEDIVKNRRTA